MLRAPSLLKVALSLALVATLVTTAQAQQRWRGMMGRSSMVGLLSMEQVQTEMKLSDEQKTKVKAITEKLMGEMREQFSALRDVEDRAQRMEKMNELSSQTDRKLREELQGLLERDQMRRLYQIRLQINTVSDSLTNERLARRLEITEEQKQKLADITKEMQAKNTELFGKMRDASQDQRGEIFQEMRQLRTSTDEKALGVLTDAQKKSFEEMKGDKFELQMPRRGGGN